MVKKSYLSAATIASISLSFLLGGCMAQPKTMQEAMYNKTARESAKIILSEIKYPTKLSNGVLIENAYIDPNDDTMVVTVYKLKQPYSEKRKISYFGQKDIKTNPKIKKSVLTTCDTMYPFFQNGGKSKYIAKWSTGETAVEYVITQDVCDTLEE